MKIGLLPLYIALYDKTSPSMRPRLEAFYETVAGLLEDRGMGVLRASFCRLESEFRQAVGRFEAEGALLASKSLSKTRGVV